MTQVWIADCEVGARQGATPFWNSPAPKIRTRLLVRAPSKDQVIEHVSASVSGGGAQLLRLISVVRAGNGGDDPVVASALRKLTDLKPVILDNPTPTGNEGGWSECNWDDVLDRSGQPAGTTVWAVVSGASWPEFAGLAESLPKDTAQCLYATQNAQSRALAPWLVRLKPATAVTAAIAGRAQDSHALVLFHSREPMDRLRAHLRRYTMLRTPQSPDTPVYFRFYDGRVMLDMLDGMAAAFLDPFLDPFDRVTVPMTWQMLMPKAAVLAGEGPTPFDPDGAMEGRLLTLETADRKSGNRTGAGRVGGADYAALETRMARRAARALARVLWTEFGELTTREDCLDVAFRARDEAAIHGLVSVKQVQAYARCMLTFSGGFPALFPEALDILQSRALLPWQKKNKLIEWYGMMIFEPERIPSGVAKT